MLYLAFRFKPLSNISGVKKVLRCETQSAYLTDRNENIKCARISCNIVECYVVSLCMPSVIYIYICVNVCLRIFMH